jgi:hypothetical protein
MRNRISMLALLGLLAAGTAWAADTGNGGGSRYRYTVRLTGAEETPPVETPTTARLFLRFNRAFDSLRYKLRVSNGRNITVAHLHCAPPDRSGPVVVDLLGAITGALQGKLEIMATLTNANIRPDAGCTATIGREITSLQELAAAMNEGLIYGNVHSVQNPVGEVRGQIARGRYTGPTTTGGTDDATGDGTNGGNDDTGTSQSSTSTSTATSPAGSGSGSGSQSQSDDTGLFGGEIAQDTSGEPPIEYVPGLGPF